MSETTEMNEMDFEKIADYYSPMIARLAASYADTYARFGVEADDLVQVALIALWEATRYVDPISEFMYVRRVILRKFYAYIFGHVTHMSQSTRWRKGGWFDEDKTVREIPMSTAFPGEDDVTPHYDVPVTDDLSSLYVRDFMDTLNDEEQAVVKHQLRHRRGDRAGRHVAGLSRATYYRRLGTVQKKLRAFEEGVNE